jgi:hypothetical protein
METIQNDVFEVLDDLRESSTMNMMGAWRPLVKTFNLSEEQAKALASPVDRF